MLLTYILNAIYIATFLQIAFSQLKPLNYAHQNDYYSAKKEIQAKSFANSDPFIGVTSKTGFINVGQNGAKIFYWIIPHQQSLSKKKHSDKKTPVAIWLTGGPGCSSELALLTENGPWTVENNGTVVKNPYSWHLAADMIYIDQPIGTGFSTNTNPSNFATNEKTIAEDMHEFLTKFLEIYSEYKNAPFYITGESYAGHYIPSIAHYLIKHPIENLKLSGVAIGNGWVDPATQYPAYADFALQNHLIGKIGYTLAKEGLKTCVDLIKKGATLVAIVQCNTVFNAIVGKKNPYDYRLDCEVPPLCYDSTAITKFLNDPIVQKKIGVHTTWEECSKKVYAFLLQDFDTQTKTKVEKLLDHGLKVLVYNGDKDIICNWVGGEAWVKSLDWKLSKNFLATQYSHWLVDGKPAGDIKSSGPLTFLKVYDAGHMVPMDQPAVSLKMIQSFFNDELTQESDADFNFQKHAYDLLLE